ncbi:integrin alpha pat-2 [Streptomyces sp. PmtG]
MRSTTYLTAAACAAALLAVTAPAQAAPAAKGTAVTKAAADFNGDGYPDLAVGAPSAKIDGIKRAGLVSIVYGSAEGLKYDKQQLVSRATPGVPGEPKETDYGWGTKADHGDLDDDGYDDLLISDGGDQLVLWGGKDGISGGTQVVGGDGSSAKSPAFRSAWHGIGDINGDGKADIVGAAQIGPWGNAQWGVGMLYGPLSRTTGKPAAIGFRDTEAEDGISVSGAEIGDMTGDGIDDVVAMGSARTPYWTSQARVLKGTRDGLVPGGTIDSRHTGTFGDLNGDGYQDFVGTPQASDVKMYGGITVTYGGPDGVSKTLPARVYDQASPGVPGAQEKGDRWGTDVAVGDLDKDGYGDLLVGASWESAKDPATAVSGSVTLLRGSKTGVTTKGAKVLTQNSKGVPSTSEKSDHFGEALGVLDADKDGTPEVYVGGMGEDTWVGRVWQLPTGPEGVTGVGSKSFNLGGGYGSAHFGEYFGK